MREAATACTASAAPGATLPTILPDRLQTSHLSTMTKRQRKMPTGITEEIRVVNAFRQAQQQQGAANSNLQRVLQKQSSLGRGMSTSGSASEILKSPSVKSPTGSVVSPTTAPQSLPSPPPASSAPPQPPPPVLSPVSPVSPVSSPSSTSASTPLSPAPPAPQLAPVLIPTAAPISTPTTEPATNPKPASPPVVQPAPVNLPKPEPPPVSKSAPVSVPKPVPVPDPISAPLLQPAPVPTPAPSISPATSSAPVNVPCSPSPKTPDAPEGKSLSHTETAV